MVFSLLIFTLLVVPLKLAGFRCCLLLILSMLFVTFTTLAEGRPILLLLHLWLYRVQVMQLLRWWVRVLVFGSHFLLQLGLLLILLLILLNSHFFLFYFDLLLVLLLVTILLVLGTLLPYLLLILWSIVDVLFLIFFVFAFKAYTNESF